MLTQQRWKGRRVDRAQDCSVSIISRLCCSHSGAIDRPLSSCDDRDLRSLWNWAARGSWPTGVGLAISIGGVLAGVTGVGDSAASQSPQIVPRDALIGGLSYSQWAAAYWRWRDSFNRLTQNPTSCLTASQSGPVWFLGGSDSNTPGTRDCAIPVGRYIVLGGPATVCSTVNKPPVYARTSAGLIRCARKLWRRTPGVLHLTLDGVPLEPAGYVVRTIAFRFRMPAQNNDLFVPGRTAGREADYGYATIMPPLTPGTHTLVGVGRYKQYPHPPEKVTYHLTVG